MYVCNCNAVKEKQILAAIANGDDSLEKLQVSLEVATCCGGCQPMIEGYLEAAKSSQVVVATSRAQTISLPTTVEIFIPSMMVA